jgi:hypothetical protein
MRELTLGQREPLFQLVRYQEKYKKEIVFGVSGGEIFAWEHRRQEDALPQVPNKVVGIWADNGYVHTSRRTVAGGPFTRDYDTFVLGQEALDYENWMGKPATIRSLITFWRKLVEDVPSLIWGVLGGVAGSILTTLVSGRLGLD